MNTIAIVQARMSSHRLPGKVLRLVDGKPMLQYLLESLGRCGRLNNVVVATSTQPDDDEVAAFCRRRGADCRRGPLDNVVERFCQVLDVHECDAFVRVNGDSPLLDHRLVDRAVALLRDGGYELVTNVRPRTFPRGQSVEVLRSDAFRRGCLHIERPEDREHVTPYFYRHPDAFRIHNFMSGHEASELHLAVDTADHLALLETVVALMDRPHWQYRWDEIVTLYEQIAVPPAGVGV